MPEQRTAPLEEGCPSPASFSSAVFTKYTQNNDHLLINLKCEGIHCQVYWESGVLQFLFCLFKHQMLIIAYGFVCEPVINMVVIKMIKSFFLSIL